jgi:Ca-activated chloride channel homolog
MKNVKYSLLVFALLFTSSLGAQSQGLGTLTGTAVDESTHAPVPDVLVTVSSPQLQGKQAVKTDSSGTYLIPQLPPGTYTIAFEKKRYMLVVQRGIVLDADRMLRLNVQLRPEGGPDN